MRNTNSKTNSKTNSNKVSIRDSDEPTQDHLPNIYSSLIREISHEKLGKNYDFIKVILDSDIETKLKITLVKNYYDNTTYPLFNIKMCEILPLIIHHIMLSDKKEKTLEKLESMLDINYTKDPNTKMSRLINMIIESYIYEKN